MENLNKNSVIKVFGLFLSLVLVGCNEVHSYAEGPKNPEKRTTYTEVRAAVFEPYNCMKCHGTVAGYSVESRDEAVKSDKLCEYLEKGYMPPKGAVPNPEETKLVCDWIADGAP